MSCARATNGAPSPAPIAAPAAAVLRKSRRPSLVMSTLVVSLWRRRCLVAPCQASTAEWATAMRLVPGQAIYLFHPPIEVRGRTAATGDIRIGVDEFVGRQLVDGALLRLALPVRERRGGDLEGDGLLRLVDRVG